MEPVTCSRCGSIVTPIIRKYPDLTDPGGGLVHISARCQAPGCGQHDQRTIHVPGWWSQAFRQPNPSDRDHRGP